MMAYRSVFEIPFDVVVYGSGYAGVAAALDFAATGRRTLLLSRSMDVLWESGRAFAALAGGADCPQWEDFTRELAARGLYRDGLLDCAAAEVAACERLRAAPESLSVLLGAPVVGGVVRGGRLCRVSVATKAGERVLTAREWVDATETGELFRLVERGIEADGVAPRRQTADSGVIQNYRVPAAYEQRVVLLGEDVDSVALPANVARGVRLERRLWAGEVTLCFSEKMPVSLAQLAQKAAAVRDALPGKAAQAAIVQLAEVPLAVFHLGAGTATPVMRGVNAAAENSDAVAAAGEAPVLRHGNIVSASPTLSQERVHTLAERFMLGVAAARKLDDVWRDMHDPKDGLRDCVEAPATSAAQRAASYLDGKLPTDGVGRKLPVADINGKQSAMDIVCELPVTDIVCDVLVAGAGSAGAVAALAAANAGAEVVVVDSAPSAGGIATGGLIVGYFHGQPGGAFETFDEQAVQIKEALDPAKVMSMGGRHQDAKKIVFEQTLLATGKGRFISEALVYDVRTQAGRVTAVYAAGRDRLYRITPKSVVDATGDGDVCALAGALFDHGRPGDGLTLSYSQPCLRVTHTREGVQVRGSNFDSGWVDATDPEDLTRARIVGIAQYWAGEWTQQAHLLQLAPVLGLRQSRHIRTHRRLSLHDMVSHSRFEDAVGSVRSPMDTHSIDYEFEDDEMLFWQWGCKHFRGMTHAQMPYGVLVPEGLRNVWIACRASGLTVSAAYGARMLRDMQRIGEVAGIAAAAAARLGCDALSVPLAAWREPLLRSGALAGCEAKDNWRDDPLGQLDAGEPGGFLWTLYADKSRYAGAVEQRLASANPHVSWLAAVVLAMWSDARAQPRLLDAIRTREEGLPTPRSALGAHGQWIDVPNWFLAVSLLRMCGTQECLPQLLQLAQEHSTLLNLRTALALTLERLGQRLYKQQGSVQQGDNRQSAPVAANASASPLTAANASAAMPSAAGASGSAPAVANASETVPSAASTSDSGASASETVPAAASAAANASGAAPLADASARYIAEQIVRELAAGPLPETCLRPSRSIYRALRGEAQLPLPQEPQGIDTREDHRWQLALALTRAALAWGLQSPMDIAPFLADERALVRRAFRGLADR